MNTPSSFASAFYMAGREGSPAHRIDSLKDVVAGQFEAVDPSVQIHKTDYFNHSVVPDLVLNWRGDRARFVYIRADEEPPELAASIGRLPEDRSVIYSPDLPRALDSALAGVSREHEALVTQPSSLEQLAESRSSTPTRLLAHGVLNAGVGLLDLEAAGTAIRATEDAFAGATSGDGDSVSRAAAVWKGLLSDEYSTRLARLVQALWEGSGNQSLKFPLPDLLSGTLTDEDLQYLLNEVEDPGKDFWARIGWSVTSEQIARLELEDNSRAGYQSLMGALRERLLVKAVRYAGYEQSIFDESAAPDGHWSRSNGCLVFTGWGWNAFLAPSRVNQLPVEDERYPGLTPRDLAKRAEHANRPIMDVRSANSKLITTIEGSSGALDVGDINRIVETTTGLVSMATVRSSDGGRLACDFETRTGTGKTSSKFSVGSILRDSVFLLNQIPDDHVDEIRDALAWDAEVPMLPSHDGT